MSLARHMCGNEESLCLRCSAPVEMPADYCGPCDRVVEAARVICNYIYGPWSSLQYGEQERGKCLLAADAVLKGGVNDDYSRVQRLHEALSKVTWMAEEWFEHNGSGWVGAEDYAADIRLARSMLSTIGQIHASDCSTHNEPASPNGPCDCGATIA